MQKPVIFCLTDKYLFILQNLHTYITICFLIDLYTLLFQTICIIFYKVKVMTKSQQPFFTSILTVFTTLKPHFNNQTVARCANAKAYNLQNANFITLSISLELNFLKDFKDARKRQFCKMLKHI